MLAPLGGIGVVAPVPYTDRDFPQMPHGRAAYDDGDAPSLSRLRGLDASASTPMRRAARAMSSRPAPAPTQPFATEENCHV